MDIDAEARSLEGPFKASGTIKSMFGRPIAKPLHFQLATGVKETDRLKIKLLLDPGSEGLRADLDGLIVFSGAGRAQSFEGDGTFSGLVQPAAAVETPWHTSGALRLDLGRLDYVAAELRAGSDERTAIATLDAHLDLGKAPAGHVVVKFKQIDFDRLLAERGEAIVPPSALLQRWAKAISDLGPSSSLGLPLELEASAEIATLGGETLSDLAGAIDSVPGQLPRGHIDVSAPGRNHLMATGIVETGSAARFSGTLRADFPDLQRLGAWLKLPAPRGCRRPCRAWANCAPCRFRVRSNCRRRRCPAMISKLPLTEPNSRDRCPSPAPSAPTRRGSMRI